MKIVILLMLYTLSVNATEKTATDTLNYSIPESIKSATVSGNLDGTNTFDRVFGDGVDSGCAHPSTDSGNDGVSYQVFEFHSPSGQAADMEVVLTGLPDSLLFVYCAFDPLSPMNMLAGLNDDDGIGFGSAIVPADGLILVAGVSYFAVVSGFGTGDMGTFDLVLGGDLLLGPVVVAAPPVMVPVNSWTSLILMFLALIAIGFVSIRKKA